MNGLRGLVIAVVAALIVGFSLGLVAGITFMRFGPPLPPFAWHGGGPGAMHGPDTGPMGMRGIAPGRGMGPGPMLGHLERELGLGDTQRAHVRAALERMRVQQVALRESTHAAIERELTDAQRARWHQLQMRYQQSWRGRTGRPLPEEGRPPGGDPDPGEER